MKVLFVAGYGHSGSTLLEQVLAKDEAFVALGEVKHLWLQGYVSNYLCGCGTPFHECPFWKQVDRTAFGGLPVADARRVFELRGTGLRPSRLPVLLARAWRGRRGRRRAESAVDTYLRHVQAVYRAALTASGATIVVDSSKDPLHGLALARMDDVSLHVVHLVRDARGVAFSFGRRKLRHSVHWKRQYTKIKSSRRSALVWSYRNLLAEALRPLAASYRRIRYEDFVARPDAVLTAIRRDVALPPTDPVLYDGHRVALPATHAVAGNPNRFEGRDVQLKLDDRWRSALPRADRAAVTLLASPLLFRYGYLFRGVGRPAQRIAAPVLSGIRRRR